MVEGGNEAILSQLWEQEAPSIRAHVRRELRDAAAAEDIVIEAFTQLAAALERGSVVDKALGGWLWRAAQSLLTDEIRRRQREVPTGLLNDEDPYEPSRPATPLPLDLAAFPDAFDRELRLLPELERDAFILTELRGLSCREAAPHLGVSHTTVCEGRKAAAEALRAAL